MTQCKGEVIVTRRFFENFAGDNVRILMRSFGQAGDYLGQVSNGFRWPYGPVLVISPFNFPLEIPALQVFGAVIAGNKPILKVATKVAVVMEQFFRMCHHVGMDKSEIDLIAAQPQMMDLLIAKADFRCIQFTGSSELAEKISKQTNGKVQMEDAGFDWKVFGADLGNVEYAAYQCDQDAYAASGQKCSAQSIAYIHKNWVKAGLIEKMKEQAAKRKLADLSVGPVLSWNNKQISEHIEAILKIPGAKILFGGKPIEGTKVPECYGLFEPTAIFVPIEQISAHAKIVFTELFGPFQIITEWEDSQLDLVLHHLESISLHLTAGVVSNDPVFVNKVIGSTVNGTTYTGNPPRQHSLPRGTWPFYRPGARPPHTRAHARSTRFISRLDTFPAGLAPDRPNKSDRSGRNGKLDCLCLNFSIRPPKTNCIRSESQNHRRSAESLGKSERAGPLRYIF